MKWWAELLRVSHPNDRWFSGIPRYSKPLTPSISLRNLFFPNFKSANTVFFSCWNPHVWRLIHIIPHQSSRIFSTQIVTSVEAALASGGSKRSSWIPENPWDFIPKLTAFPLCNACTWVLINVCVFWFGHVWQKNCPKKKCFNVFFWSTHMHCSTTWPTQINSYST